MLLVYNLNRHLFEVLTLIFKNVMRNKRSIINADLIKYPKKIQHPVIDRKMGVLSIFDVSQALCLLLTTINQTFFYKRAISRFFGTVALTDKPGFYLFKFNGRNTKTLKQDVKCV